MVRVVFSPNKQTAPVSESRSLGKPDKHRCDTGARTEARYSEGIQSWQTSDTAAPTRGMDAF